MWYQLVVFVPESARESVKDALFSAGAGQQGHYSHCAWETQGVGQFRPNAQATPAVGAVDALSQVVEWRIECLVSAERWPLVRAALIESHPYESPAFSLIALSDSGAHA